MLRLVAGCVCLAATSPVLGQQRPLPIIDMHLHAMAANALGPPPQAICVPLLPFLPIVQGANWPEASWMSRDPACTDPVWSPATDDSLRQRTLEILERRNIIAVTSGLFQFVQRWKQASPDRIIPAVAFNLAGAPLSVDSLRKLHQSGQLSVLGEVTNALAGIGASDSAFEPYLALAEQIGMPVGIHIGTGPPGAPYLGATRYRASLHSPFQLEDALVRHPRLRLYVMHAGWPMLDDMLAVLWTHPQVYVEVGIIVYGLPQAEFYRYLRTLVEAGFGNRIMFGSDQMLWPETLERAIERIEQAPFLTSEQKRDILYNNAARFLGLSQDEVARHHGR